MSIQRAFWDFNGQMSLPLAFWSMLSGGYKMMRLSICRSRRSISSSVQRSNRSISGLAGLIPDGDFFNRSPELSVLDKLLRPQTAGSLVILSGPRDSGKSALLREFRLRQAQGQYSGASCLADLRDVGSGTTAGVARMFQSSFLNVGIQNIETSAGVKGKLELELKEIRKADDMDKFLRAMRSYGLKWRHSFKNGCEAGFPTIIVDEANRLHSWLADDAGRKDLEQLLAFFVMVTKQEGIMNVVLASSENFFREWIEGFIGQRSLVMNIGDLHEAEARQYFASLIVPEVISDELWQDIYHHLGGRMGLLVRAARFTAEWEGQKNALLASCRTELLAALEPDALDFKKPSPPKWSKEDWIFVMKSLVKNEDGVGSYFWLCDKLSMRKVNSMIEHDLLHYRQYTAWGRDIVRPPASFPLVMPASKLHLRVIEELAKYSKF